MKSRILKIAVAAGALLLGVAPASAEMTAKDVQVMARALGFTDKAPSGNITIGIVYSPGSGQSAKEAEELQQMMAGGMSAGTLVLKPVMVKIDDAGSADVGAFLMTEGMGGDGAKLAAITKSKQKPCVTVDMAQVQSGACVMGIKSEPKVEIVVNKAAAQASGVGFAAAFRMMITEI